MNNSDDSMDNVLKSEFYRRNWDLFLAYLFLFLALIIIGSMSCTVGFGCMMSGMYLLPFVFIGEGILILIAIIRTILVKNLRTWQRLVAIAPLLLLIISFFFPHLYVIIRYSIF